MAIISRINLLLLFISIANISAFAAITNNVNSNQRHNKVSSLSSKLQYRSKDLSLRASDGTIAATTSIPSKPRGGDASIATSTFNLAKSIIGAGVLSLPSGVAFFSDEPLALVPASIITTIMGLLAAYSFSLIGKACEETNATSFQDAWAKSVNPKTAWVISSGITATCFLASLAYSIIIGDSFTSLARTFNVPAQLATRSNIILAVTTVALLPLCSLKSLNALAPFSLLGLGGTLYTAIFMAIRYLDGSYNPGGQFFKGLAAAAQPSFSKRGGMSLSPTIFVLVSMLSTSFIAHFNAPKFYNELENNTMKRFNTVIGSAFITSILTFIFITSAGFLTFGGATTGFVLNNYAGTDKLATLARLAIGIALLTGYPFTFSALRDGILDLMKITDKTKRDNLFPSLTVGLIGIVTTLALLLRDVGFVVSLSGALFGTALMFVVPAIMYISNLNKSNKVLTTSMKWERRFNYGLIGTGVIMGILGVVISVLRQIGIL